MSETIFTKIVTREIPADIIYEDATLLAFLDISPVAKGHTLLIVKQPYEWMQDVPDTDIAHAFITAKKLILAMKKSLACDYVQIAVTGKDVPHFHIHLIPKMLPDSPDFTKGPGYIEGEAAVYALKIKSAL